VLTMYSLYKNFGPDLVPDAPQDMIAFLQEETDASARRNAFLMLCNCAQDVAVDYYLQHAEETQNFGDGFQLVVLELTRRVCRSDPAKKTHFIKSIFQLLQSSSPAVVFEAAGTVVALSTAPTAVRAAAQAYTQLLVKESDNNVKLIVLERLSALKKAHPRVMREIVMDILRALSCPNEDIQRKTLDIAMGLVSPRNVEEVMNVLRKEILKTQQSATGDAKANKGYRELLIKAIHSCGVKFPEVANSVVLVLMDFLGSDGASSVILFVRCVAVAELACPVLTSRRFTVCAVWCSCLLCGFAVTLWRVSRSYVRAC
jgi:coatomer subunit beta